jgi:hypothetical protein
VKPARREDEGALRHDHSIVLEFDGTAIGNIESDLDIWAHIEDKVLQKRPETAVE